MHRRNDLAAVAELGTLGNQTSLNGIRRFVKNLLVATLFAARAQLRSRSSVAPSDGDVGEPRRAHKW